MSVQLPELFKARMRRLLGGAYARFLAGYDAPPRRGLRVNTLKCGAGSLRALLPLSLEPVPWCPDGFSFEGEWKAGADPLHHAGAYYMQEPSAMTAAAALAPRPGERILDLCAAPGGKSTQIAAALRGEGLLWSNEVVRPRAQILAQNLERCGVRNAVLSSCGVEALCAGLPGWFDGVLVDAPCSGEGMFRKEPEALSGWSVDNIRLCAARQREILRAAAGAVRPGGRLAYSTCTFAPEENEGIAAWFLREFPEFSLEEIPVGFGVPGLPWEAVSPFVPDVEGGGLPLARCRRIFPGQGGEGHFVALFRRAADAPGAPSPHAYAYALDAAVRMETEKLLASCLSVPPWGEPAAAGGQIRLLPPGLPELKGLGVLSAGTAAADICRNRLEPCHALFLAARREDCAQCLDLPLGDPRLAAFLRGEEIEAGGLQGWTAVAAAGVTAGFGKASGGRLKNRYPKGLRLRG